MIKMKYFKQIEDAAFYGPGGFAWIWKNGRIGIVGVCLPANFEDFSMEMAYLPMCKPGSGMKAIKETVFRDATVYPYTGRKRKFTVLTPIWSGSHGGFYGRIADGKIFTETEYEAYMAGEPIEGDWIQALVNFWDRSRDLIIKKLRIR